MELAELKVMQTEAELSGKQSELEHIAAKMEYSEAKLRYKEHALNESSEEIKYLRLYIIAVLTITIGIGALFLHWMSNINNKFNNASSTENVFYKP